MIREEKKNNVSLIELYHELFQALISQKKVIFPFLFFALVELVFLVLIYLIPRQPFIKFLGPPIRVFWGEVYLHYPSNFLLLPKLASLSRNFLSLFIGPLTTGLAVRFAVLAFSKKTVLKWSNELILVLKKYWSLFFVILTVIIIFNIFLKINLHIVKSIIFSNIMSFLKLNSQIIYSVSMLTLNFLIAIFLQCLFIYSVPFIIVAQNGVFKAIGKGILLFFKNFWITFIIVVLPFLFYIPIIILQDNTTKIIEKMFPEFVLYICIIGTLVNALIVDLFMTVASTYLYLKYTKNQ